MLKYILKRLLAGVLTMVVLITVAFFMMHAMPGGPFSPSEEKNVPKQVLERIAASYGLDQPVWKQYLNYWKNLLNGDLGVSYKTIGTVNEKIANHFPYSARVGGLAVVFSLLVGIPMGLIAALYRGKVADFTTLALATIGISVPVFVLSLLLGYLFSYKLKWLPTYGLDSWTCYILPVVCLSFNPTHGPGQGRQRADGRGQARPEKRPHPHHYLPGAAGGRPSDGIVRRGKPLRHPRPGLLFRAQHF